MATRTVDGIKFTKSQHTHSWEAKEQGIEIFPTFTGNMCSQVAYYYIRVNGKGSQEHTLAQAMKSAVKAFNYKPQVQA